MQTQYPPNSNIKIDVGFKVYKCGICDESYSELNDYKNHIKIHGQKQLSNPNPKRGGTFVEGSDLKCYKKVNLKCENCNYFFVFECDLLRHKKSCGLNTEKPQNDFKLNEQKNHNQISTGGGQTKSLAQLHVLTKPFQCTVCCQSFSDNKSLESHKMIHLCCEICNTLFDDQRELESHRKIHTTVKNSQCDICNMTSTCKCHFTNREDQTVLSNRKSKNLKIVLKKKFVCKICEKLFVTAENLQRHMKSHENKRFECPVCKKSYVCKLDMLRHSDTHSTKTNRACVCSLCQKICFDQYFLQKHIATHYVVRNEYICKLCGRYFSQNCLLRRHVETVHNNNKLNVFRCSVCNRRYFSRKGLSCHMECHRNNDTELSQREKYQCNVCNKYMSSSGSLRRHERGHTGEKPFQCEICNASFVSRTGLRRHQLSHTNEKPYECDVCRKRFSLNCNMLVHRKIHTGEKPFKCEMCGERFRVKCLFESHVTRKHK